MPNIAFEKLSFGAVFLSLVAVLCYLAVALESARNGNVFSACSHCVQSLVAEHAMKGLLLTAILGFSLDFYLKKSASYTKN